MTFLSQLILTVQDPDQRERRIVLRPDSAPRYERLIAGAWCGEDEWADVGELLEPYRKFFTT